MNRNSKFTMLRSPARKDRSNYSDIFNDADLEEVPMSSKKTDFLEKQVLPDDTLQSIALEFNVSVADLKRVNNIHKENEIFARKVIKIPHKPYSLLLESKFFKGANKDEPGPSNEGISKPIKDEADVLVDIVKNSVSTPLTPLSAQSSPIEDVGDNETDVLLRARPTSPDLSPLKCNGDETDCSVGFLVFVVIFLTIGGPAFYIWFFWVRIEHGS